jgi:hypothetical protein
MQAIHTKFLSPTNFRGSRYKATCCAMTITISAQHELTPEQNHEAACAELCKRMDERCAKEYGASIPGTWSKPKVCGQLADGSYVHVFVE